MAWKALASTAIDWNELEGQLELFTAPNGCLPPPQNKGGLLLSIRCTAAPQPHLGNENGRKAGRAEKCKRLRIFINSTPKSREGRGTRPGLSCTEEIARGFSYEAGTVQPRSPSHCAQQGSLCQQRPVKTGYRNPACLSLLATAVGRRCLLIQVGWDTSLIFDFNKLVRIYFSLVYVLFQLT